MGANFMYLIPIIGMGFVSFTLFLAYKEKQLKYKDKIGLIEKGLDPTLIDIKPIKEPSAYKIGSLLIGAALAILLGYVINLFWGIPRFVAYSTMILLICGIVLVFFHKSKTE